MYAGSSLISLQCSWTVGWVGVASVGQCVCACVCVCGFTGHGAVVVLLGLCYDPGPRRLPE